MSLTGIIFGGAARFIAGLIPSHLSKKEEPKPYYVTEPDESTITNIVKAFKKDMPENYQGKSLNEVLGLFVPRLCKEGEAVLLKELKGKNGRSCQITRPVEDRYVPVKGALFGLMPGKAARVKETAHPIDISELTIDKDEKFGYIGNLEFHDPAGDLKDFVIVIDNRLYKAGLFVNAKTAGEELAEYTARTGITFPTGIEGLVHTPEVIPLACEGTKKKLYSHSGGGVKFFGDLPEGKHEFMFYAMDKKGNRSFAIIEYDI